MLKIQEQITQNNPFIDINTITDSFLDMLEKMNLTERHIGRLRELIKKAVNNNTAGRSDEKNRIQWPKVTLPHEPLRYVRSAEDEKKNVLGSDIDSLIKSALSPWHISDRGEVVCDEKGGGIFNKITQVRYAEDTMGREIVVAKITYTVFSKQPLSITINEAGYFDRNTYVKINSINSIISGTKIINNAQNFLDKKLKKIGFQICI